MTKNINQSSWPPAHFMELRDYFAAQALGGLVALPSSWLVRDGPVAEHIVNCAYELADAMLKARSQS